MAERKPIFVDLHGSGMPGGDDPYEPAVPKCWHGREKLWIVFWAYGLFGSGAVLGIWLALTLIALQIGLVIDPVKGGGGLYGATTGLALGALLALPYTVWIAVSLWRCAPNCINPLWGRLVRGGLLVLLAVLVYAGIRKLVITTT